MFNFPPLRAELQARGHAFRSRTDTETIVHLFEGRGIECLHALRGMFALAIWDGRARELWLARDRLGKKPLYYFSDPSRLVFGSGIKCLLAYPDVPCALDASALPLYLTYGYVPAPDTMFAGIRMLRPGCWLRVANGGVEEREYWSPPIPPVGATPASPPTEPEAISALLDHIREAVHLRLISDVPLGAFLSGGLDSSAIVDLMAEAVSGPVKTFAIGFSGEPSYDETARAVAQHLGTEHHEFIVRPDAVDLVPKLAWHFDQPFGDSSAIPTYLVSKLARARHRGPHRRRRRRTLCRIRLLSRRETGPTLSARAAAPAPRPRRPCPPQAAKHRLRRHRSARVAVCGCRAAAIARAIPGMGGNHVAGIGAETAHPHWWRPAFSLRALLPRGRFRRSRFRTRPARREPALIPPRRPAHQSRPHEHGRLARSPFPVFGSCAGRIHCRPARLAQAARRRRQIHSQASLCRPPAAGDHPPAQARLWRAGGQWFRATLRDYWHDTALSPRAQARGLVRPQVMRQLAAEHLSGERDHGHVLWTLLMLEVWAETFLDNAQCTIPNAH